jgi:hypothetical protein
MLSHFPFEDLKFKLWSKERVGVKLTFATLTLSNNHIKPLQSHNLVRWKVVSSSQIWTMMCFVDWLVHGSFVHHFGFNLHKSHFLFMCANWLHLRLMFACEFVIIPFCSTPMFSFIVGIKECAMGFHFVTKLKIDYCFTLHIIE